MGIKIDSFIQYDTLQTDLDYIISG